MTTRRSFVRAIAGAAAAPLLARNIAYAQPIRQLTIVVPAPPGGATDVMARVLAEGMTGRYAEVVVVDNRAGAAGLIGTKYVATAPADGSVLLYTPAFPLAIFPHIYKTIPYDALQDFAPVVSTTKGGLALSVGPAVPASVRTVKDFVAWCTANPEKASYGAPAGSGQHFAGALFAHQAGIPLRMIGYKGGAPALTDLLGGHIAAAVNPIPEILPYARDGKVRVLATTTSKRSRFLQEIPTMDEVGYQVLFEDWSGLVAPARTPRDTVARASAAAIEALRGSKLEATLEKIGVELDINPPEKFATVYRSTWERYRDIVKATGFTADK